MPLIELSRPSTGRMSLRTRAEGRITAGALRHLLARLDADGDRAALEYERLRRSLIKFFDWRGVWPPDECADDVLDRLARKLEGGTTVDDVPKYALGIARVVLLERRRDPIIIAIDEAVDLARRPAVDPSGEDEGLHDCFDKCLMQLPQDSRALITGYYEGERGAKIANRRRLALSLSLSDNALRSRVQRLRDRLERCVQNCVSSALKAT